MLLGTTKGKIFEAKFVHCKKVAPKVTASIIFVIFNNLSLQYNIVGVHQLVKVMCTPVLVTIQISFYLSKKEPLLRVLPLIQICIGVIQICIGVSVATISSLRINGIIGILWKTIKLGVDGGETLLSGSDYGIYGEMECVDSESR